jgi:5-methylcytosine-specific restriction endonuclease McrA
MHVGDDLRMALISRCAEPGCFELAVRRGRCRLHLRKQQRRRLRPSGWKSSRLRRLVLARDRVCRCCAARASQIAHHVQPLEAGGDDNERNVIGLCSECHRAVHAAVLDAHASPALAELWRAARRRRSVVHADVS